MAQILDKQGLQHYANKMCNADNRKVGSKNLPTALNEIDTAIDGFKTLFESEYGSALDMKLENNENVFSVGTGTNIDKRSEVENSFTDVELSGNSLVNLYIKTVPEAKQGVMTNNNDTYTITRDESSTSSTYLQFELNPSLFKANTTYTVILTGYSTSSTKSDLCFYDRSNAKDICRIKSSALKNNSIGVFNFVDYNSTKLQFLVYAESVANASVSCNSNILILEGDWTNKPIPQYFEGLKSIGEKEDGNHKIEILSQTLNLVDDFSKYVKGSNQTTFTKINNHSFSVEGNGSQLWQQANFNIPFIQNAKAGDTFTLFAEEITLLNQDTSSDIGIQMRNTTLNISISNSWQVNANKPIRNGLIKFTIPNDYNGTDILDLRVHVNHGVALANKVTIKNLMIVKGHVDISSFKPHKSNKKEISLNEPLRGLPNGVKDTIEKVNGEWKIVRRCGEIIFDGSETWGRSANSDLKELTSHFSATNFKSSSSTIICDKYKCVNIPLVDCEEEAVKVSGEFWVNINKSRLSTDTVAGFKEWLSQNNIRVIYKLETPIIEDISPVTLQCWKNGTISIDEVLPIETTHTVALNKSAQIQKNIEELSILRNRIEALEKQYNNSTLNQAYELELLRLDMQLDNII